jgi:RimJ/RimL family protein N-acetyltransferase
MQVFLETERLILRRFTEADEDKLFELNSDPAVMRYLTGGKPYSREVSQREIVRYLTYYERFAGFGYWAAIERASGDFLGWISLKPQEGVRRDTSPAEVELGYRLRQAAWGKGYATEGARALIRKGYAELGVQRVVANTMTVNIASRRVMEKVGMRLFRIYYQDWPERIAGAEHGDVEYALERADWERQQALEGERGPAGEDGRAARE